MSKPTPQPVAPAIGQRMTFHKKLAALLIGRNKAKAARDVGLPESTLSTYLCKTDSLPRCDIALKIARACGVPLSWLVDDELPWPPPEKPSERPAAPVDTAPQVLELPAPMGGHYRITVEGVACVRIDFPGENASAVADAGVTGAGCGVKDRAAFTS